MSSQPPPKAATASTSSRPAATAGIQANGSPYTRALLAGALAGTTVDLSLHPLDTLKTRLQSSAGFRASGGLRGLYKGIGSSFVGSAPGAALFFVTYERTKTLLSSAGLGAEHTPTSPSTITNSSTTTQTSLLPNEHRDNKKAALNHILAASLGETAACAVRVPTEVIKQRAQANAHPSSAAALRAILSLYSTRGFAGVWRALYRGWGITVLRELPFTAIQFPLWERLKAWRLRTTGGAQVSVTDSALYGSLSGGVAAAATTPLDVLKTRVMLAKEGERGVMRVLREVWRKEGWSGFFRGVGPRTGWIAVGGCVFLGSYQWGVNTLEGIV